MFHCQKTAQPRRTGSLSQPSDPSLVLAVSGLQVPLGSTYTDTCGDLSITHQQKNTTKDQPPMIHQVKNQKKHLYLLNPQPHHPYTDPKVAHTDPPISLPFHFLFCCLLKNFPSSKNSDQVTNHQTCKCGDAKLHFQISRGGMKRLKLRNAAPTPL